MTILLNTTEQHVHFIGIGGYGMSAIARVMLEMGYTVTGSDVASQELTEKLAAKGAKNLHRPYRRTRTWGGFGRLLYRAAEG